MKGFIAILILLGLLISGSVQAEIIVENTAGGSPLFLVEYLGQSFTTPSNGPWDNITINFFTVAGAPTALGDLFLLDTQYLGTPASLSNATPGFVAESTSISAGEWVFDPSATLLSNTMYWFYSDAQWTVGSQTGGFNTYSGGIFYGNGEGTSSGTATANFAGNSTEDTDFRVQGTAVPEPSTLLLLGAGLAGLGIVRRMFRI